MPVSLHYSCIIFSFAINTFVLTISHIHIKINIPTDRNSYKAMEHSVKFHVHCYLNLFLQFKYFIIWKKKKKIGQPLYIKPLYIYLYTQVNICKYDILYSWCARIIRINAVLHLLILHHINIMKKENWIYINVILFFSFLFDNKKCI